MLAWPDFLLGKELLTWQGQNLLLNRLLLQPKSIPAKSEILQSLAKEKKKGGEERTDCPRLQSEISPFLSEKPQVVSLVTYD